MIWNFAHSLKGIYVRNRDQILASFFVIIEMGGGGVLTEKRPKNSRYTKIGKLALFFFCFFWFFWFLKFPNWHWFFLVFFGIGFDQNSKLKTGFFGFLWFF